MEIEYELNLKEGVIYIQSTNDAFPPKEIDIDKFFGWVKTNGLNGWCKDWFDPSTSSHEQETGYYSFEEYFENYHSYVAKDLIEYLKLKRIID